MKSSLPKHFAGCETLNRLDLGVENPHISLSLGVCEIVVRVLLQKQKRGASWCAISTHQGMVDARVAVTIESSELGRPNIGWGLVDS
jgi:hypothetical protein